MNASPQLDRTVPMDLWEAMANGVYPAFADSYLSGAVLERRTLTLTVKGQTAFKRLSGNPEAQRVLRELGITLALPAKPMSESAKVWDWPTQDEYDAMPLPEQIRQNRIMASRCRSDAGPQGEFTRPEDMPDAWKAYRVKATQYEAEAKHLNEIFRPSR